MKKHCVTYILFLFLMIMFSPSSYAKQSDNALETAIALNYCHMSLYKIIQYNDRIVLDEEYSEIINNINLTKIKDEEIIELLRSLMDTISQFKLNEGDKKLLYSEYESQLSNAFYSSFSSLSGMPLSGNPYTMAATMLVSVGSAYANYRNNMEMYRKQLDKSLWELDKKAILVLNDVRKDFIKSYWILMKRYNIPDEWRITEKQMDQYISVLKDRDPGRKFRNLQRLQSSFEAYPPFWYYMGQAAQDLKDQKSALKAYGKLRTTQMGFFREDNIYASALMSEISLLDIKRDKSKILTNLKIINTQSPLDYRKNIFSALWYMNFGEYNHARERLQINIDNGKNSSINQQLIGRVYLKQNDTKLYNALVDEMLLKDNVCNQEILYLIGKEPELKTLQKIKDQIINIYVVINEKTFRKDDLIITVPDKWIFWDKNVFKINLILNKKTYVPNKMTVDKQKRLVSYYFEKVIDSNDILSNRKIVPVTFIFSSTAYPITLVGDLRVFYTREEKGIINKGYDKSTDFVSQGYDKAKGVFVSSKNDTNKQPKDAEAKKPQDTLKTTYFVKYSTREIRTKDSCYRITEKNEIAECK